MQQTQWCWALVFSVIFKPELPSKKLEMNKNKIVENSYWKPCKANSVNFRGLYVLALQI